MLVSVGLLGLVCAYVMTVRPAAGSGVEKDKITICHATSSESNPFNEITVAPDSILGGQGHGGHPDDIIPPFVVIDNGVSESYPGMNLDTIYGGRVTGAEVLANGCEIPTGAIETTVTSTETTVTTGTTLTVTTITTTVPTTVTVPGATVTLPPVTTTSVSTVTVTAPATTVTLPGSTTVITVPSGSTTTVTLPAQTVTVPPLTETVPGGRSSGRPRRRSCPERPRR